MKIRLAETRGFCAGVDRALEIVDRALELFGAPVYVRHEVVHNRFVVEDFRKRGAIFVEELAEIPKGAIVVFSAHGVSQEVRREAAARGLKVFDATCPLVTKVHLEALRHARQGRECILIGHRGHPEVEGTMGQYEGEIADSMHLVEDIEQAERVAVRDPEQLAYVTQTTLSVDDTRKIIETLKRRFPKIIGPRKDDICYATQNRQDAVRRLSAECDLILVVGSANSSNSNRLRELAEREGVEAHLVGSAADIRSEWLQGRKTVGVSSGASAPESLVEGVIDHLCRLGAERPAETRRREENIHFVVPRELR